MLVKVINIACFLRAHFPLTSSNYDAESIANVFVFYMKSEKKEITIIPYIKSCMHF